MEASKLTIRPSMYHGGRQIDILKWMHSKVIENPRAFKDTTAFAICNQYVAAKSNTGVTYSSVRQAFAKMIVKNIIIKEGGGRRRRTNFRINYLHPSIPQEMLDSMTDEDKKFVKSVNDRVNEKKNNGENVELDPETATIVTKPNKEPEEPEEPTATSCTTGRGKEGRRQYLSHD